LGGCRKALSRVRVLNVDLSWAEEDDGGGEVEDLEEEEGDEGGGVGGKGLRGSKDATILVGLNVMSYKANVTSGIYSLSSAEQLFQRCLT
jgi:hypothetical protein